MPYTTLSEKQTLENLCELSLNPSPSIDCLTKIRKLTLSEREEILRLASVNHVVMRALEPVAKWSTMEGDTELAHWSATAIANEQARIENALVHLHAVCTELEAAGCSVTVMKSLDHYPDLGSDLDLYTTATENQVRAVFENKFNAHSEPRSWGDRMAQKYNFTIPGLPETIEVHIQRLGQMGEHTELAKRFVQRRISKKVNGRDYFVPAAEERIIVATLQRMYRHFYFRICDMVNSAAIYESGELDIQELKQVTEKAGIWPGVASYLKIVSDFVERYRGRSLKLQETVLRSAICNGDDIYARNSFFRVPIVPKGATLYTQQVTRAAFSGNVPATLRLGLLPYLASAAAISYKLTGNDKGVW